MELRFLFFGVYLLLCITVVLIERKRDLDWPKIAKSWVPFLLPSFLGGLAWVSPGSSGVVKVALLSLLAFALLMMLIKLRRR
jgi:hypothetical protein